MAKDFMSLTGANQKQSQLDALKKIGDYGFGVNGGRVVMNGTNLSVFEGDVENFKKTNLGGFTGEQLEAVFGALDSDGDGKLNTTEIQAFASMGEDTNYVIDNDKSIIDETDFQALYEVAQDYVDKALAEEIPEETTPAQTTTTTTTDQTVTPVAEETPEQVQRTVSNLSDRDAGSLAAELYTAMKGLGTDEATVNRIILESGYNAADLVKIMDAYEGKYGDTLMSWIQDDFSGSEETPLREALYGATAQMALETTGWKSTDDIPNNIADKADSLYSVLEHGNDDKAMKEFDQLSDSEKTQIMLAMDLLHPDKSAMTRVTQNVYGPGKEDKYVDHILTAMKNVGKENINVKSDTTDTTAENTVQEQAPEFSARTTISDRDAGSAAAELYTAMKGLGTDEDTVNRILLEKGYNSADIVKIMDAYQDKYGESLMSWIQDDYSGTEETLLRETLYSAAAQQAALSVGWKSTDDIPSNIADKADSLYSVLEHGNDDKAMKEFDKLPDSEKSQIMLAMEILHPDKSAMTRVTQNVYGAGKEDKYVDHIINSLIDTAKGRN